MRLQKTTETRVAIIGMAGRFPGAQNIDEFWENIKNKVESISFFSEDELIRSDVLPTCLDDNNYIRAKGYLKDASLFDADFFKFNRHEAEILDPQFRLFLEAAWEALENAAYVPDNAAEKIGLFAGSSTSNYYLNNLMNNSQLGSLSHANEMLLLTSNAKDFLTTLLAYKLNLTGPCVTVQTACSTSLVAVCMACDSLLASNCDIALAGGVSITTPLKSGYLFQEGMILSPDGHCRAFDAASHGTVSGNGLGVLVLKRLDRALKDHDNIHAIIKGYSVNNDGSNKIGYTAPSIEGQREVIQAALDKAKIKAEMIGYIETHGTGTRLGDPIEMKALTKVFSSSPGETHKHSIALGALKSNIGHLDIAAGLAGAIKAIQALKYRILPPNINFENLNSEINFSNTPFYINTSEQPWAEQSHPRFAGVSSFGIGGTNAHIILQEPSPATTSKTNSLPILLVLSAKKRSALIRRRRSLIKYFQSHPDSTLDDVAFTLQVGRKTMEDRFACICVSIEQAIEKLNKLHETEILDLDLNMLDQADKNQYHKLYSIAKDWLSGNSVDWKKTYSASLPYRLPLPTYPFERREYWVRPDTKSQTKSQPKKSTNNSEMNREALEFKIKEIFKSFLGADIINSVDDFYDLGGDSLLVLQVLVEIKKKLGLTISIAALEKYSTARSLAQFIQNEINEDK